MENTFNKIIEILKKTGDRCIVFDRHSGEAFAVVSLDEYERLLSKNTDIAHLTQNELLDKINRDIAVWKERQDVESDGAMQDIEEMLQDNLFKEQGEREGSTITHIKLNEEALDDEESDVSETEKRYYFEPIE